MYLRLVYGQNHYTLGYLDQFYQSENNKKFKYKHFGFLDIK